MEFKNILVPVDFSEFSDNAVASALLLAEHFHANITLVHVMVSFPDEIKEESDIHEYRQFIDKREVQVQQQLQVQFDESSIQNTSVKYVVLHGISPTDSLQDFINENYFDLVVLGSHGRTGLKHFVPGSVAEKTVRVSPIPVLTIHRSTRKPDINKILVPIDFSVYCNQSIDYAVSIAQKYGAKIVFLHVIEHEVYPSFYGDDVRSIFDIDSNLQNSVITNLKEFVEDQVEESLIDSFLVTEGQAHKEIVQHANNSEIDLLVIATHGLSGVEYLMLGSTSEKVIRWSNCPVLTVKR